MTDEQIQQLISSYVDGECTPEEQQQIEDLLIAEPKWQAYYKDLLKMADILNEWNDEPVSADLDQKMQRALQGVQVKEDSKMKPQKWNFRFAGVTVLVAVIAVIFTVQRYENYQAQLKTPSVKGGQPATVSVPAPAAPKPLAQVLEKATATLATTKLNQQMAANSQQYEPAYLAADYDVARESGGTPVMMNRNISGAMPMMGLARMDMADGMRIIPEPFPAEPGYPVIEPSASFNTEEYARIYENPFKDVTQEALSTFSIDVDTASYSNVRRFLNSNQLPSPDAVRIEELVNYFSYDYLQPQGDDPFSITVDAATAPWNDKHQLVRIGLKGKSLEAETLPPSNLVFLIDVSGSMNNADKLPLLKQAYRMMVNQLSDKERVAIVVYAGAAGKVLDSTPGSQKSTIMQAIDNLTAGGSTAGGQGIQLAYQIAQENFIKGGNNRVVLATDGDFNIGVSNTADLTRLIEEKRQKGIFLTVLGFGNGNYKDNRMEQLADKGNGNYYYIDTLQEAKKVLVQELGSTLFTIAKDVKIQVEFNPTQVKAYRLIGYENRVMAKEDFNDDTKDAGELGAGHTVTALYEIVLAGSEETFGDVDPLKYQTTQVAPSDDLLTVKLRYKKPDEDVSKLIEKTIAKSEITAAPQGDFAFAAAVAEFGMLLRQSEHKGNATYSQVLQAAQNAKGEDSFGYRAEFIKLVEQAQVLDSRPEPGQGIQFK